MAVQVMLRVVNRDNINGHYWTRVDGDTMNYVVFFSPQSNDEIKRIFKSKAFYIGADGKLAYSIATNTLVYTIKSMHRLAKGK